MTKNVQAVVVKTAFLVTLIEVAIPAIAIKIFDYIPTIFVSAAYIAAAILSATSIIIFVAKRTARRLAEEAADDDQRQKQRSFTEEDSLRNRAKVAAAKASQLSQTQGKIK